MLTPDQLAALRAAAAVTGWPNDTYWQPQDDGEPAEGVYEIGSMDESDEQYPVMTINTASYDAPEFAEKLARFYVAFNPETARQLLAHIDAQAARIAELELEAERNELLWKGWKAKTKDLEHQLAKTHHDLLTAMVCIGERDSEIEDAKQSRYSHITSADVIKLASQISEPVHVWARPNASAAWTLIPIPPGNARGIEYGMASWEFAGPVYPPGKPCTS
nr:hypothetical protein [Chromobacterium sp. ASV5]